MGDSFVRTIDKIKTKLIVALILWLILVIVFVAPLGLAVYEANQEGVNFSEQIIKSLGDYITKPLTSTLKCLSGDAHGHFGQVLGLFSLVYGLAILYAFLRAIPKHKYEGIENGSSDWCENGEQYKILNRKKGIILAEKNYLPVDKRGNVNVLVVGRFWCW
ncbi:MAG: hypothetical protein IKG42_06535 [Clostridia bacterium]|nr:hypothetical protein [Clostridia bacterium]